MIERAAVSVMIPAHRRVEKLRHTLEVLRRCSPGPTEVMVHVDGGSAEVCGMLRTEFPEVRVMTSDRLVGPGGARNRMIQQARQEWVATFDDDSYPESLDFFAAALDAAARFPQAAVLSWDTLSGAHAARGFHHIAVFSGCGSVFSKSWFLRTRGFVPRVVAYGFEEVDVSLQLHCLGGMVLYDPRLRVVHDHPLPERFPVAIVAGAVVNAFLFPLARFPMALLPVGFFAALRYAVRIAAGGRLDAIGHALKLLPGEVWEIWSLRTPLPFALVRQWLMLRRHPHELGIRP